MFCQIGASGAAAIAASLKVNSSLQELGLEQNEIGDMGATAIAASLKVNSTLLHFNLRCNEIGFRSFGMNDVPSALWPHALAKVSDYPSLTLHLLRQDPGSLNFGEADFF
jgi:hypothetical protein